jgi:hypothetical protein
MTFGLYLILALIERRYNEGTLAPGKIRAQ